MKDLQKAFLKTTGLTFSIEKKLKNAKTEEEKEKIFKKLSWQMHKGGLTQNNTSEFAQQYANTIIGLSNELNLSEETISNIKEIKEANEILSANSIEIKNGISTEEELINACLSVGEYTLTNNIDLINMITVKGQVVLNLNGYNITKSTNTASGKCVVFYLSDENASLTINGKGKIEALGGLNGGDNVNIIIWTCDNTTAILNDGYYHSSPKNGSDLIYNQGGKIFINGGEFLIDTITENSFSKPQFAICNIYDSKRQNESFVIKGGKFHNFNPMNNVSEGNDTNFVAEGYTVIVNGKENTECYDVEMGDVIYEVIKK